MTQRNARFGPDALGWPLSAILLLALFGFTSPAVAGDNVWTKVGPYGGEVHAVAADPLNPQVVYASAGSGGLYKSTNGGASWTLLRPEQSGVWTMSIEVAPSNSQMVYAGGWRWGVYRSTDGGASWNAANAGIPDSTTVDDIRVASSDPRLVYISAYRWLRNSTGTGYPAYTLYKSTNGGDSWTPMKSVRSDFARVALSVDPSNPQTLYFYAGGASKTEDEGLYKSADGGASWNKLNLGLPFSDSPNPRRVVIHPSNPQTLYFATPKGVYRSTDGGGSWTQVNAGLSTNNVQTLLIDPSSPQTLYVGTKALLQGSSYVGGMFKSTDGGNTWAPVSSGLPAWASVSGLAVDAKNAQAIYAGTADGIYKSADGGTSWKQISFGLGGYNVWGVAGGPSRSRALYAGTQSAGVFKSADGGASWTQVYGRNVSNASVQVLAIAVAPSDPQTVYFEAGPLYKSTDGGATWTRVWSSTVQGLGPGGNGIRAILVDPQNAQTVYFGMANMPPSFPTNPRVQKSVDGGSTWTPMDSGLPPRIYVYAMAIDPSNTRTLYLTGKDDQYKSSAGAVYKSTDGGASWSATGLKVAASVLAVDPTNPQTVYAGFEDTTGGIVYRSADGGGSWAVSLNLPPGTSFGALAIDPTNPKRVYAGTNAGVFRSTDGGATWRDFSAGLPDLLVKSLRIDPEMQTVYAGTLGGSVYAIRVTDAGSSALLADFDGSGEVNFDDFFLFADAFGKPASGVSAKFDLDGSGAINLDDFFLFADRFGQRAQ